MRVGKTKGNGDDVGSFISSVQNLSEWTVHPTQYSVRSVRQSTPSLPNRKWLPFPSLRGVFPSAFLRLIVVPE